MSLLITNSELIGRAVSEDLNRHQNILESLVLAVRSLTGSEQSCQITTLRRPITQTVQKMHSLSRIEANTCIRGPSDLAANSNLINWNSFKYCLPIGTFYIEQETVEDFQRPDIPECQKMGVLARSGGSSSAKFTFAPRSWLSNSVVSIETGPQYRGDIPRIKFSLDFYPFHNYPFHHSLLAINEMSPSQRLLTIENIQDYAQALKVGRNRKPFSRSP